MRPYLWHPDDRIRAAENCTAYRRRWTLTREQMARQCNTNARVIAAIEGGYELAAKFTQCVGYVLHLSMEKPPRQVRPGPGRWDWPPILLGAQEELIVIEEAPGWDRGPTLIKAWIGDDAAAEARARVAMHPRRK